ncbi:hypothetical protein TSAR_012018 [Trichomalopsis sarcophagae]|uniref:Peptidase S1 domain-containing protein n=1 Tax=Trichomalopsis sarcophagae TaxID=543379 RepID=A0A232F7W1_9HYME|nr:hypothetical protein TSAR_012018 [Trichomalopsis sarcophagae]
MNRATLLLCLFGIVSSNLINNVAARLGGEGIVGGERADEKQFPYQVALLVKGKLVCGGGIIGDKYILTAAHCFIDKDGSFYNKAYTVVAGSTDLNLDEGIEITPEKVYVHKGYQPPNFDNDIAILKLKEGLGVDSDPSLSKLNLPKANLKYTGRTAVISGYGFTTIQVMTHPLIGIPMEVGGSTDNKLHFTEVDIISNAECSQRNAPKPVYNSNICGQVKQHNPSKPEGICSGDSGSPLVVDDDVVIGVVSTSPLGCDETVEAASYTRVSSHLSFIENVLKGKYTTEVSIFEIPDDKPAQKPSAGFPFFPSYPSYGQDDDIFSIPQYGDQDPQFPSHSLPFYSLGYKKRKLHLSRVKQTRVDQSTRRRRGLFRQQTAFAEAIVIINEKCNKIVGKPVLPSYLCAKVASFFLHPEGVCSHSKSVIFIGTATAAARWCMMAKP